jgi:MFS family permease
MSEDERVSLVPLGRNRDFVLLQGGQLLSAAGSQSSSIAYPLLVLALTHSPAKAGIVGAARILPFALFALPAGVAADRWNRRRLMLTTDVIQALAIGSLATGILSGWLPFALIPAIAFVEATASVFFSTASTGALRSVVPRPQLPAAAGAEQARLSVVRLAGPPVGGALFGIGRSVPFIADAVSYLFSFASLLAIRTPFQEERDVDSARLRTQIAEGFRFLWREPFLRTAALIFSAGNLVGSALTFAVVVIARGQGLSSGKVGVLVAAIGVFQVAGAFASGVARRRLGMRAILVAELWCSVAVVAFVVHPSIYVLVAGVFPQAFVIPITDSVLMAYRFAVTPDRLIGRVTSAARSIGILMMPLGPLAAGFLLDAYSARTTIALCAAGALVLAVWATFSPSIRQAPNLDDLTRLPAPPSALPADDGAA